jgi:hypothetical protein
MPFPFAWGKISLREWLSSSSSLFGRQDASTGGKSCLSVSIQFIRDIATYFLTFIRFSISIAINALERQLFCA